MKYKCSVCVILLISHRDLIRIQFSSIWLNRDKLLVLLWNAPLEPIKITEIQLWPRTINSD